MTEGLNFKDKTILITGSTRGIGYGYAQYLASLGANLVINGISQHNVNLALESLQGSAGQIVGIAKPVTQGEDIVDFALQKFPRVDAVINNACYSNQTSLISLGFISPEKLNLTMANFVKNRDFQSNTTKKFLYISIAREAN